MAEDEALILMDIEEMLSDLGCEIVGPVATVDAALAAVRLHELDGALLDMNLHGERITPVVAELVSRGVRFVLATGYAREPSDEVAIRDAPRLSKPFNLGTLRAAMDETFLGA